jgi:ATP-dependent DNA helicase DinG
MKDILDCWPFPEFKSRDNQIVALNWLQKQDAKYLLLELPVGSGKSAIGLTFSKWFAQFKSSYYDDDGTKLERNNSFILTPQRMLQLQYEKSVEDNDEIDMASLYGRSNYTCKPHNTTCDIGNEIKPKCTGCPCDIAREIAKEADEAVMNYALALNSFAFTDGFSPRKLIIFDECHTIEEHLVSFGTLSITKARGDKYKLPFLIPENQKDAYIWVRDRYLDKLTDKVLDMKSTYDTLKERTDLKAKDKKFIKDYNTLSKHMRQTKKLLQMDLETFNKEYVFTSDKIKFEFKRLYGRETFQHILEPMADKFLFMSSTILNKKGFCEDLGLDPEDTAFLSMGSEFDVKNRKVIYLPQTKMNAKWNKPENASGKKKMLDTVNAITAMNKEHSGIIHTGNYQIAKWLTENLKTSQKIYHHNPGTGAKMDRNSIITAFQEEPKPSILISPSITEGLDLKDDLGRFAIFCKIPFGFLGDAWIKTRMNISDEWYKRRALIDIIQGGGRIVRTETDWGTVFILDESWGFLFRTTNYMIPPWWKAAYYDRS